ncbi:MAG: polysaccharide deacetylase family protein [Candidatus Omnitrophica bacterium]|nr:polysaccharide deacetylase family protein [Candidatus Omnitrophota bacterium]
MIKKINEYLKLIISKILSFLVSIIPLRLAIMMLPRKLCFFGHVISDDKLPTRKLFRYPSFKELEKFINLMQASGYDFVSYRNYIKKDNKKKVLLTFDDGLKEIYTQLHPYMLRRRIPYMVFILTETFKKPDFMTKEYEACVSHEKKCFLNLEEVVKLKTDGVDIGFHTNTHFRISDDTKTASADMLKEITIDKEYEDIFTKPLAFAYPFAAPKKYEEFDAILSKAGFENTFDTKWWLSDFKNHFFRWPMDIKNEKIKCENCIIFHIKKIIIKRLLPLYILRN